MADPIECAGCHAMLSDAYAQVPRLPCPKCGRTNRILSEAMSEGLEMTDSVMVSQRFGHTDREVLISKAMGQAREWSSLKNWDDLLKHPVAQEFRAHVQAASRLAGTPMVLYRGQGITGPIPPSIDRMGPLPLHRTPGEGRYHRAAERVLYLTNSEEGARREMGAWLARGVPFVIRVDIPLASLKVADFSAYPSDHLVTSVFAHAEMSKLKDRGSYDYLFSQVVGAIVSETFDGMLIPGVRGQPGTHYKNVVLFRQLSDWASWAKDPPYRPIGWHFVDASHDEIAVAAYYLWEKDGRPHGRDQDYWYSAINELRWRI